MAVRLGASLFAGGAMATLLGVLLPHQAQVDTGGYLVLVCAQLVIALGVLSFPRRFIDTVLPVVVAGSGIVVITAALYLNGERAGGDPLFNELFYVWPAVYSGYFFSRRGLAAGLGLTALAHFCVLKVIGAPDTSLLTRWMCTTAVVAGVAVAAHALRQHVDRLLHRLREATRTDLLTGVLNRRGFEEAFGVELQRAGRSGAPLAVVIGDVDRFKALNDRFGHAAGDAALKAIAATLRDRCRAADVIARIGGEEFAILMPDTQRDCACTIADRLRTAVSGLTDPAGAPLTISFGVTVCASPEGADPDRLLRGADRALYAAKGAGRDRTVAA